MSATHAQDALIDPSWCAVLLPDAKQKEAKWIHTEVCFGNFAFDAEISSHSLYIEVEMRLGRL